MTEPQDPRADIVQRLLAANQVGLDSQDMRQVARAQAASVSGMVSRVRSPRCLICNAGDDVVSFVNKMIVSGATYVSVHRSLDAINEARVQIGQSEIGYQTVVRHAKNHLPFKSAAVREIIERRARAAQLDYEEGTANIVTAAAYAEAMFTKAFQDLSETPVSASEGLRAAQFFNELMKDEKGNTGIEAAFAELGYLIEAVKEIVPSEYFARIVAKIEEKRGVRVIESTTADEEFDPGEDEDFDPTPDDDGEDF